MFECCSKNGLKTQNWNYLGSCPNSESYNLVLRFQLDSRLKQTNQSYSFFTSHSLYLFVLSALLNPLLQFDHSYRQGKQHSTVREINLPKNW